MSKIIQGVVYTKTFLMVLSSDHVSPGTGLTVTVTLSKAGGAFAAAGGTVTEIANGWYKIALTVTDTNTLGDLAFHCTAATADPTDFAESVVLDAVGSVTGAVGSVTGAVGSITGVTFPTNFSTLGISGGGHVSNVDTLTTYTGNTVQSGDTFTRLGAPSGASIAADIAGLPAIVWNALTSAMSTAGSIGLKLKNWALGTDNKSLVSTDAGNIVSLSVADEGVMGHLATMINGTPAFTAPALALAPTGGSAPTVNQIAAAILVTPANLIASDSSGRTTSNLNLAQAVPSTGNTAHTVGDALNAARADGFGPWGIVGTTLNLYASDGTTVVHAFTLNSSTVPTART